VDEKSYVEKQRSGEGEGEGEKKTLLRVKRSSASSSKAPYPENEKGAKNAKTKRKKLQHPLFFPWPDHTPDPLNIEKNKGKRTSASPRSAQI